MGTMYFGLVAARDVVPDVWDIANAITQSLDELKKAADAQGRS